MTTHGLRSHLDGQENYVKKKQGNIILNKSLLFKIEVHIMQQLNMDGWIISLG